jgi:hypothetical protein
MKRLTRISMLSLLLATVPALPINAQQQSPRGPSEPAGRQDTATTPNVQQPNDSNSTTPQGPGNTSSDVNRQSSSPSGSIQPGPINSNVPGAPATTSAPNWILAIISLAIGLGIGYVMGRRSLGIRPSSGRDMPSPGRA